MSLSPASTPIEANNLLIRKSSSHSGKWSRSSSRSRADPHSGHKSPISERMIDNEDIEADDSEFHLASSHVDDVKNSTAGRKNVPSYKRPPMQLKGNSSSIPLSKQTPAKLAPKPKTSKANSFSKVSNAVKNPTNNKRTLEIQFLNKSKRYNQLKKDLVEKQRPLVEVYQNLLQIKKKLADLGKCVKIEDLKFINPEQYELLAQGGGEVNNETLLNFRSAIEAIPKTLTDVCKNLLSRRSAIVELLQTITKANLDSKFLEDKVQSLKLEGEELQKSLDLMIEDHEKKINDLVLNWQKLLHEKPEDNTLSDKVDELTCKLRQQDKLIAESQQVIQDLQKRLDEKKYSHDKLSSELETIIKKHEEKIKKLEQDLECEKKLNADHKNRNATSVQTIKSLKNKIADLESRGKDMDSRSTDLHKKLGHVQDQLRLKESCWQKEKDDLTRTLKQNESLLQKLTVDRNLLETRCRKTEEQNTSNEKKLALELEATRREVGKREQAIESVKMELAETMKKCDTMEDFIRKIGEKNKESMDFVTSKINWGKSTACTEAELLSELLSMKVTVRNYEDSNKQYEEEVKRLTKENQAMLSEVKNLKMMKQSRDHDPISKYQVLLEDSERKLNEKSVQIANLQAEIRHLKVRQNAIDEQNEHLPTSELVQMVNEGKGKMNELIKKSIDNDQKIMEYEALVEKQQKQMSEMENLLKMRNGLLGVMKSKKEELQLEKESLTRYSNEMRSILYGIKEDLRNKTETIHELSEKLDQKEKACLRLEKKVAELEDNLAITNQKRFKLQDTLGSMEKELQTTKAHINQHLTNPESRYDNLNIEQSALDITTTSLISQPTTNNTTIETSVAHHHNVPNLNEMNVDNMIPPSIKQSNVSYNTPQAVTDALFGMSLKHIDSIRSRIDQLNNLQFKQTVGNNDYYHQFSTFKMQTENNFENVLQIKAKHCEILQDRADQSHEDLSKFLNSLYNKNEGQIKRDTHSYLDNSDFSAFNFDKFKAKVRDKYNMNNTNLNVAKSCTHVCKNMDIENKSLPETVSDLNETIESLKSSIRDVQNKLYK